MVCIFSYQKSQFGYILEGVGRENFGFLCPIERFCGLSLTKKIWQP
jgi:hypothetical protein